MEEYLLLIEATKECPNDELFAAQIRLQLFAQKIVEVREKLGSSRREAPKVAPDLDFPSLLYLKTIQDRLQEFKSSLSPDLQQQGESIQVG